MAAEELHERFVLLRVGVEWPGDPEVNTMLVALHEFDLVRVRRLVRFAPPPWLLLELDGAEVNWDHNVPDLGVFKVDYDEARDGVPSYTEDMLRELEQANFLPEEVRARIRRELTTGRGKR